MMDRIRKLLFQRLESVGVGADSVSGLMRDVANCLRIDGDMSLIEVNRRLRYLGWEDGQLDYHTYQLLVAWIEDQAAAESSDHLGLPPNAAPRVSGAPA
jgi:hypothetical protein